MFNAIKNTSKRTYYIEKDYLKEIRNGRVEELIKSHPTVCRANSHYETKRGFPKSGCLWKQGLCIKILNTRYGNGASVVVRAR